MDKLYTIQEVAGKLNLSDKTLRRWEEAGRFTPSRTLGNQRRYTLEDLQILDAIKHGTINEQKDLLTTEQAGKLCGVSATTITRWEESGKIHPLITSGNTYYPRQKLVQKMDELKKLPIEPIIPTPPPVPVGARHVSPATKEPKLSSLIPRANNNSPLPISPIFINAAITIVLITTYHFLFNQPSAPISPQTGAVQGVSTVATPDPRLDDLITKFQDHLSAEMLKDARPIPVTTINLTGSTLIYGTGTLPKGKDQISVTNDKITPTSPLTLSFASDYAPAKKYWVTTTQGSFTLHTDFPVGADSAFNYNLIPATASPSAIIKP